MLEKDTGSSAAPSIDAEATERPDARGRPSPGDGGGAERPGLVGESAGLRAAVALAEAYASCELPVLVGGETGTGKDLVARLIHAASPRAGGPFVAVDCSAIPEHLFEAELFGARKGAFTGAERDRTGLARAAAGGTLFLDEIGELRPDHQAKLLRALQSRAARPVGADREIPLDVRVVAATHRDLARAVETGRFRADLYHRVAALEVRLPPLRDRLDDLPDLATFLLDRLAARFRVPRATLDRTAIDGLRDRPWPGNVRELEAVLARAALTCRDGTIDADDVLAAAAPRARPGEPSPQRRAPGTPARTPPSERAWIEAHLAAGVSIADAARAIGWTRQKLYRRVRALGLALPARATMPANDPQPRRTTRRSSSSTFQ